jgi:hypothetical protein
MIRWKIVSLTHEEVLWVLNNEEAFNSWNHTMNLSNTVKRRSVEMELEN